jgi:uncharacterized protein YegP (UPF0339 family)
MANARRAQFQIFTGDNGQTFVRHKAKNGEILNVSEGLRDRDAAIGNIISVKRDAADAVVIDMRNGKREVVDITKHRSGRNAEGVQ